MEGKKKIIILYELEQLTELHTLLAHEGVALDACTVVPLEFDIELALREQEITYESLTTFVPLDEEFADVLGAARSIARRVHEHSAMQFYGYKGINLGEVFEPMLDTYLEHLGRYAAIAKRVVEMSHPEVLYVPHTTKTLSPRMGALVDFWFLSPLQALQAVGRQYNIEVRALGVPPRSLRDEVSLGVRCMLLALSLYNRCIALVPRRPLKIFASEYWSHIAAFVEPMDDMELLLMERNEIKNIPWRQLIKHRVRFVHPGDVITSRMRREIDAAGRRLKTQWHEVKGALAAFGEELVTGISLWPELERALEHMVETYTPLALIDIEGLEHIMKKELPDKVLLRASIGGSAEHFFIATQIAHQQGIPSIELQHAGAVVDPRSAHSRLAASYLASYGALERELYKKNGYASPRIRPVGSPRFDNYVQRRDALHNDRSETLKSGGLDPSKPVVFAAVPFAGAYPIVHSSYQVADFFASFRRAQEEIPGLQVIFKFRPGGIAPSYRRHIEKLFLGQHIMLTDTTDFLPLIVASDVAVSGRSTLMYEIMLGGRPMILFPWLRWDTYNLALLGDAVPVAWTTQELVEKLNLLLHPEESASAIERQNTFLSENYSFDGHAPERVMALLRKKLLPLP